LKWAESADEFIDENFKPASITNSISNWENHNFRAKNQSILIGSNTALRDNPMLTVRHLSGKNPIRIVLDKKLLIPKNFHILNQESETIILNEKEEKNVQNLHYVKLNFNENLLYNLMNLLYQKNIQSLIVEGGAFTLNEFLKYDIWDEIRVFKSKDLVLKKGTKAPNITNYKEYSTTNFRNDELKIYRR